MNVTNSENAELEESGKIDEYMTQRMSRLDSEYRSIQKVHVNPEIVGYEIIDDESAEMLVLKAFGRNFENDNTVYFDNKPLPTSFIKESELHAELPADFLKSELKYNQITVSKGPPKNILSKALGKTALLNLIITPDTPKAGKPFDITLKFRNLSETYLSVIKIEVFFPNGERKDGYYKVSEQENKNGSKTVPGFVSAKWGTVKVRITSFSNTGTTGTDYVQFDIVPSNPFQVTVYPRYDGASWKGAVQYESSTGRYYCRARVVFSNGYDYSAIVTPLVLATVTDGGSHVTSFWFSIDSNITVEANSSKTLYVYTYYRNSDTADIFSNFGDVTINLKFTTTHGLISDSAVWVMMGQIKVACNFVGNFSWDEKTAAQNIVLGQASSIYENVDMQLTSAPILVIPSSNSDWNRYRDIDVDCKNGGVTSDEANDMRSGWSSPGEYPKHIDLWFVESFSGESCAATLAGFSKTPGPASKSGGDSGVVIDVKDLNILTSSWGQDFLGLAVAHELGHYLGTEHDETANNFMNSNGSTSNVDIKWSQHNDIADHDWVQKINP